MSDKGGNTIENVGYMLSPMGLSERQLLIYKKLYEKCNFSNMTVKYTIEQLSCDIKIIDIPPMTIYKNIQNMIKKGYLEVYQKASKGNAPIYKIAKINELMGKPKINQEKTEGKPKVSNTNILNSEYESQRKAKGKPKDSPIKEKEKDNIYSDIINYLNNKTDSKYRSNTQATKSLINARLKDGFTLNDFYQVINIKSHEWLNNSEMNKYLRPQTLFGTKFESYLNQVPKQQTSIDNDGIREF